MQVGRSASIYHGLPKLPKFGKLFYNSFLQARMLGGRGGRWEGPSIDQGWHLTRPLAPSGPSVIPCNGAPPDNETWGRGFVRPNSFNPSLVRSSLCTTTWALHMFSGRRNVQQNNIPLPKLFVSPCTAHCKL